MSNKEKSSQVTSIRFRKDILEVLDLLAKSQGRTRTGYMEWLIIQTAKKEGYDIEY